MTPGAPLLITSDDVLVGDLLRLAAAAGAPLDVVRTPDGAMRSWVTAATVLVGSDLAGPVAAVRPPRREAVHVVGVGATPDTVFRSAVDLGAASVLELPAADDWLVTLLTDIGEDRAGAGTTVAVVGGSGGVGATVLACALALTAGAGRGGPAMLVDLDPWGPGLHRLVGIDEPAGVTWRDLAESTGRLGSRSLREALPSRSGVGVLGWSDELQHPPDALVREVISAGQRGHAWVVLDLPRSGPVTDELVARCDHVVLVVRDAVGSVAATAKVADRLRSQARSAGVVVRSRRRSALAEDVARTVRLPLLAELPDQRRLEEHLGLGLGPVHQRRGPLAAAAGRLVEQLGGTR